MNLKTQTFSFRTIKGYGLAGAVIASVLFSQGVVAADTVKPTTDARIEAAEQPRAVELGSVVVTHYDTNGSQLALDVVEKDNGMHLARLQRKKRLPCHIFINALKKM